MKVGRDLDMISSPGLPFSLPIVGQSRTTAATHLSATVLLSAGLPDGAGLQAELHSTQALLVDSQRQFHHLEEQWSEERGGFARVCLSGAGRHGSCKQWPDPHVTALKLSTLVISCCNYVCSPHPLRAGRCGS